MSYLKAVEVLNDHAALGSSAWEYDDKAREVWTLIEGAVCRFPPGVAVNVARRLMTIDLGCPGSMLFSADGETSPVSLSRGPGVSIQVTMNLSPTGYEFLASQAEKRGETLEKVLERALSIYKAARTEEVAGNDAAG